MAPLDTRRKRRLLWLAGGLAVLVFVALRLAILATALDRLGHLGDGELSHANLAWDLKAHRFHAPLSSYQVVPFHGGTLVSTLAFVPWSKVFGDEYASLKGLALAYALLAMLLWMWSLNRAAGPGAAASFAWLYALSPPVLVRMQLTLWSTHAELNACLAASVALATLAATRPPHRRAPWLVLFGVSVGFAIYFNLSALLFETLLAPAVLLDRQDRQALSSRWMVLSGVAIGIIPLALSVTVGAGTLAIYDQGPGSLLSGAASRLVRLPSLAALVPPFSPQIPPLAPMQPTPVRTALAVVTLGACLGLAAGARWVVRPARSIFRAVGAYPFLFLPVLAAVHLPFTTSTAGTFGYCPRYAATLYPVLYAALALSTTGILKKRSGLVSRIDRAGRPPGAHRFQIGRAARLGATGILISAAFALAIPSLLDDMRLIDPTTPWMAKRFAGVRLFRAGLRGVDRRSLKDVLAYLDREQQGAVPPDFGRCVRAILGPPWDTDFWRFLSRPPAGPPGRQVSTRARTASRKAQSSTCRAGIAWAAEVALGRHPPFPEFPAIPPPDP